MGLICSEVIEAMQTFNIGDGSHNNSMGLLSDKQSLKVDTNSDKKSKKEKLSGADKKNFFYGKKGSSKKGGSKGSGNKGSGNKGSGNKGKQESKSKSLTVKDNKDKEKDNNDDDKSTAINCSSCKVGSKTTFSSLGNSSTLDIGEGEYPY